MYYSKLERSLYKHSTVEVKAVAIRSVIVNSHHPNAFHLSECIQQVGHVTTSASGYTYTCAHGVPCNHSSAQTNLASIEHLGQSSQTWLQQHQKCSEKSVVPASKPTAFAHHVPASRIGCRAACTAICGGQCENGSSIPMDANNESVRFDQQGNENECHSKLIMLI